MLVCIIILTAVGCKKADNEDRNYGYAKIIVKCEKKCNVLYGTPEKMNAFDVEASTATYYQRYQRNYNLDINITPVDADQSIDLSVYSREEKQIFHNSVVRKSNVLWNSKILIP
ncbi:hypothetical protein GCM10007352_28600 [Mucilaginibacter phyllosphaerae]|nr:hypothetical protein GCM10007352_28600 [Mucilaginibacter phyllosphaerae]